MSATGASCEFIGECEWQLGATINAPNATIRRAITVLRFYDNPPSPRT